MSTNHSSHTRTDNIKVTTAIGVSESAKRVKSKHKEVKDDALKNPFNLTGKATNILLVI